MPLTAGCLALALVLPAILPFGLIGGQPRDRGCPHCALVVGLDGGRRDAAARRAARAGALRHRTRRRHGGGPAASLARPAGVGRGGLVLSAGLAWGRETREPAAFTLAAAADRAGSTTRSPPAPASRSSTSPRRACPYTELTRHAFFLTELFNGSIDRVAAIGDSAPDGLPIERSTSARGGRFVATNGEPLVADYVADAARVDARGRRITRATGAGLVLWETRGQVALADPSLREERSRARNCR